MSGTPHLLDPTQVALVGYVNCRRKCGNVVLTHVSHRTYGLCDECIAAGHLAEIREIAFIHGGQRFTLPARGKARGRRNRQADRQRGRIVRRAERRALTRLKNLAPSLYDVLLAEERVKEGLPAMTIERAITERPDDVETWERLLSEAP